MVELIIMLNQIYFIYFIPMSKTINISVYDLESMEKEIEELKKENKSLKEQNEKLELHIQAKDKAYMDLLADYDYLKARIKKTERAFIKYGEKHKKLFIDLDMVVMNR